MRAARPAHRSRLIASAFATALALVIGSSSMVSAGTEVSGTPLRLLKRMERKVERPSGYDRSLFNHWVDQDGDGCDARREVLIAETSEPLAVGTGCSFAGGRWHSAYDGVTTTDSSTFDIDHMVALKEAWDSGARGWSSNRRRAFANDLGDPRSLRAVSAGSNRSKSDRDPAEWLPPKRSFRCTYATHWVVVKVRWRLAADRVEKQALRSILESCPTKKVRVTVR
jgi:hypothetical protein